MDPERMMDNTTDPLELTLLQAGRADEMSEASRHGILSGLGLMLPLVTAGLPGNAGATTVGELPSGVSRIDLGIDGGVDTFGSQSGVVQTGVAQTGIAQTGIAQTGIAQTGIAQTGIAQTGLTRTAELGSSSGAGSVSGAGVAGGSAFAGKSLALAAAALVTGALAIWSLRSEPGEAGSASIAGGASIAVGTSAVGAGAVGTGAVGVNGGDEAATGLADRAGSRPGNDAADTVRGPNSPITDARGDESLGTNGATGTPLTELGSSAAKLGSPSSAAVPHALGATADERAEQGTEGTAGASDQRAEVAARTPAPGIRGSASRGQVEDHRVRRPKASDGSRAQARSSAPGSSPGAKPNKKLDEKRSEDVSTLSVELELIDSARRALRSSSPRAALQKLDEYGARFPNGRLRTEATILRIEALMAAGDRAAASRLGKSVLDRAPNSPYARRVRSLLGDE